MLKIPSFSTNIKCILKHIYYDPLILYAKLLYAKKGHRKNDYHRTVDIIVLKKYVWPKSDITF